MVSDLGWCSVRSEVRAVATASARRQGEAVGIAVLEDDAGRVECGREGLLLGSAGVRVGSGVGCGLLCLVVVVGCVAAALTRSQPASTHAYGNSAGGVSARQRTREARPSIDEAISEVRQT